MRACAACTSGPGQSQRTLLAPGFYILHAPRRAHRPRAARPLSAAGNLTLMPTLLAAAAAAPSLQPPIPFHAHKRQRATGEKARMHAPRGVWARCADGTPKLLQCCSTLSPWQQATAQAPPRWAWRSAVVRWRTTAASVETGGIQRGEGASGVGGRRRGRVRHHNNNWTE